MAKTKTWTQKIAQHDSLAMEGAGLLYDRVKLLMEVHDDPEFRSDMQAREQDVYEFLDQKVGDTGQPYLVLVAVMDEFPDKRQWQGQLLQRMIAEIMERDREKRVADTVKGERTSWKQLYEELKQRYDGAIRENEILRARLDEVERLVGKQLTVA